MVGVGLDGWKWLKKVSLGLSSGVWKHESLKIINFFFQIIDFFVTIFFWNENWSWKFDIRKGFNFSLKIRRITPRFSSTHTKFHKIYFWVTTLPLYVSLPPEKMRLFHTKIQLFVIFLQFVYKLLPRLNRINLQLKSFTLDLWR